MNVFIGLDVSLESTAICVVTENGKISQATSVASEPEALVKALQETKSNVLCVGMEAGPLSQWLHKHLTDAGFETVLMETRHVKSVLKAMPIKTDRRDAEGIARLLQTGWYRSVHCKSASAQETRALLTARRSLQRGILNLELSIRGVLRNFGLKVGKVSKGEYEARIRELAIGNPMLELAVVATLNARATMKDQFAELDRQLLALAKRDPVSRLMMTMPGVGAIVALTVKSAIDDPGRFKSSKDVGPWAGLTPKRNQSGETDIVGRITKAGDTSLRAALYQAATVMLNNAKHNWLTAWALRVASRRGKKRATVALARRICVVLHNMWQHRTKFELTRAGAMSTQV
ncbi:IS110 family transposase [Ruegeria atlantica]|uniref:IS110 family transposase n=1 Tax=Ruegeria atlantica TaxID=81569 RepID=UPI00147CC90D|nr:IS110 family transposase [Ruegeria atlantica]